MDDPSLGLRMMGAGRKTLPDVFFLPDWYCRPTGAAARRCCRAVGVVVQLALRCEQRCLATDTGNRQVTPCDLRCRSTDVAALPAPLHDWRWRAASAAAWSAAARLALTFSGRPVATRPAPQISAGRYLKLGHLKLVPVPNLRWCADGRRPGQQTRSRWRRAR